jgi:serine protease Do
MSASGYSRRQARSLAAAVVGLALCGAAGSAFAVEPTNKQTEQAIERALELSSAFEQVASKVSPAVVHIKATSGSAPATPQGRGRGNAGDPNDPMEPFRRMFPDQFRGQPNQERSSTGSGVIVSKDGFILTNNHVVEGADTVEVSLGENEESRHTAKVIGTDPATDLAVLKIDGTDFPFAELGDSDALRIGEWVIAIGNPFDLNRTVTAGIVSAKGRVQRQGQLQNVQFQDFIQTDAAINPGNSGGPLLNLRGQIVGINSAILSRSGGSVGIGFSIPAVLAKSVMQQLIDSGKVERGFLGIGGMQTVSADLAKSYNFVGSGVLVNEVAEGGPAKLAGLQTEDIIVKINGRATPNVDVLINTVAALSPGKTVPVEIFREGKSTSLDVTVGKRPTETAVIESDDPDVAISPAEKGLGITVRTIDDDVRQQLRDRRAKGVVVTEVERGSLGARANFRPGIIIERVGATEITSAADFRSAMSQVDLRQGVRMAVRIGGVTQRLAVRDDR